MNGSFTSAYPRRAALCVALWLLGGGALAAPMDEIRQILLEKALNPPSPQQLADLRGENLAPALALIDPYAQWFPPADSPPGDEIRRIGADLYSEQGHYWLLPYVDGPMARQGESQRVMLTAVADRAVSGLTPQQVGALISRSDDRPIEMRIANSPDAPTRRLTLIPEVFTPVSLERLAEPPGALRIRRFSSGETRNFLQATLQSLPSNQPIHLDLRDARGGDLFEALDSAALFLPQGRLLVTSINAQGRRIVYQAPPGPEFPQSLTLEIGPGTASAAEIFAGILQQQGRAQLIGSTTQGKCRSQTEVSLSDGSRLRFTNLRILLPQGTDCEGQGISP